LLTKRKYSGAIPLRMRRILENDPYMQYCAYCGTFGAQWHHPFRHAGRRVNEIWAIVPLCPKCHLRSDKFIVNEFSAYIALVRYRTLYKSWDHICQKYLNRDWEQEHSYNSDIVIQKCRILPIYERARDSILDLARRYPEIMEK